MKKTLIWIGALVVGAILGILGIDWLDEAMNFVATIYTRLFQLLAVPTIVLAVITTFATFGSKGSGKIFGRTLSYTLLTTFAAAAVGAVLYVIIAPGNLPLETINDASQASAINSQTSYVDHLISIIPNNIIKPFLEGNVLSLLMLAFAIGIGLSKLPESDNKVVITKGLLGLQDLLFLLIRWLIWTLPLGIVAFSAQLSAQVNAGVVADSIGKYVLVVLGGNAIQFFVVLPLFLLIRGLNPVRILSKMMPAVLMALFTKSMNGCAAFILVTSLFVIQQGGETITFDTIALWTLISVISAVGNAGVPMGCYFLTLSLMSGIGAPVAVLGIILPIYTIIDMVETAENVWSDSCVAAAVDHDISGQNE